ncbi:Peptidyl-prolyl cis-trans isomerase-like 4 [Polyrhizophydium stewartii]|uniref:Peptidyl-prolyl cis-trans isomerase n=1 Tax=Polyrhizophydium stewartii TaxID=2732419 RepID=A0ABR4MW83_9FUNG
MSVILETSLGEITVDLEVDRAPKASLNFLKLCKAKYYNFVLFHSVQKGFVAQTGDPSGTGADGSSVWGLIHGPGRRLFEPQIHPKLKHRKKGTVSMALVPTDGRLMAGSQFLITLTDNHLEYLDGKQAVFGHVAEGLEVLDKINDAICDQDGRPYRDIRIKHTIILDDPFDDPEGLVVPDKSPIPSEELLKQSRIADDEELDLGLPAEELEKLKRKEEAEARAITLEMIGDLPFADIKPPENVLFVCKLNPVTRDEDLEIIFSRFGKILSCEVIRDKKTNDSLGYAFIEFDTKEACEEDNVLIDDRRIHVDFSQSVSKLHADVLLGKRNPIEDYGEGFQKRRRFREGNASASNDYDLVFEHGGDLASEKDDSRSSKRARGDYERDRDRHDRDRDRDRDRNRDRYDRDRDRDRHRR